MDYNKLTSEQIETLTIKHDQWQLNTEKTSLSRQYKFKNFIQAMDFMNACADFAESINHHPNWSNVYNKVDVLLTTHSEKSLTNLDADMINFMDETFLK